MKAKELANLLLEHPEFEVLFRDFDAETGNLLAFENIQVDDIGHSDKVIILGGTIES